MAGNDQTDKTKTENPFFDQVGQGEGGQTVAETAPARPADLGVIPTQPPVPDQAETQAVVAPPIPEQPLQGPAQETPVPFDRLPVDQSQPSGEPNPQIVGTPVVKDQVASVEQTNPAPETAAVEVEQVQTTGNPSHLKLHRDPSAAVPTEGADHIAEGSDAVDPVKDPSAREVVQAVDREAQKAGFYPRLQGTNDVAEIAKIEDQMNKAA
jgi:hypothetical protein